MNPPPPSDSTELAEVLRRDEAAKEDLNGSRMTVYEDGRN